MIPLPWASRASATAIPDRNQVPCMGTASWSICRGGTSSCLQGRALQVLYRLTQVPSPWRVFTLLMVFPLQSKTKSKVFGESIKRIFFIIFKWLFLF